MSIPRSVSDLNVATAGKAVTPNDTSDTAYSTGIARSLYVGVGGNVTLIDYEGNVVLFTNVQSGQILPIAHRLVKTTGTTATNMVAMF